MDMATPQETIELEDGWMNMRMTSRKVGLLGAALLFGCGIEDIEHGGADDEDFPTRMAEGYCAALFACDPVNTCQQGSPYASEAECVEAERTLLDEAQAAARDASLAYDAECVESLLADFEALGCDGRRGAELRRTISFQCTPYHGTVPVDENPCFEILGSNFSECGRNLFCDQETASCESFTAPECACDETSSCVYDSVWQDHCYPMLQLGETCSDASGLIGACTSDAFCSFQPSEAVPWGSVCAPRRGLGETCNSGEECLSSSCLGACVPESPLLCEYEYSPRQWR